MYAHKATYGELSIMSARYSAGRFGSYYIRARRVLGYAVDYPFVICHDAESFDEIIKTFGSPRTSNSQMHRERGTFNVRRNFLTGIPPRERHVRRMKRALMKKKKKNPHDDN